METRRILILAMIAVAFSTLNQSPARAEVTVKQIESAKTVEELVSLGATKLTAAQFKAKLVGVKMSGDGWNWIIDANGTTSSSATDGSWKEENQPWSMKGDQYCAKLEGKVRCRDVYLIGKYFRMSDKDNKKKLSPWTAKTK